MSQLSKKQRQGLRERTDEFGAKRSSIVASLLDTIDALESELALNQAAIVREAIDIIELSPTFHAHSDRPTLCHCEICAYVRGNVTEIKARIPTDQPALDRYVAERVREEMKLFPIEQLKRAASMLAMLTDRNKKGEKTINDFADELAETWIALKQRQSLAAASPVSEQAGAPEHREEQP